MTRRLPALLVSLVLAGALVACGGDGDDDAAADPSTATSSETDGPDPEPTEDAVLPIWEDRLCAGLSLPEVSAALGKPTTVVNDLVAGDPDPILQGNELAHPYCNLESGKTSAELIVNELEAGTPLLQDIRRGLAAVIGAGFLECGKPRATQAVPDHEGYVYTCQGPQGTIGNAAVQMGPDWALTCAVTGGTQNEKVALATVTDFCAVAVATLAG